MAEQRLARTRAASRTPPAFETAEHRQVREEFLAPAIAELVDREARAFGYDTGWRRPSDTAAEQLARRGVTANVIEGDHH